MNILLANDDGIDAYGLHVLADALAQMADVENIYIIAPNTQRSCGGHGLTLNGKIDLEPINPMEFNEKVNWAYSCSGVPADCTRIGIFMLKQAGVSLDLVCTGINHGSNWGSDIFYSGTLAAAREASVCFTQAIAFSLCDNHPTHFEHFAKLVPEVVKKAYKKLPYTTVLNVNVPDIPAEEIKGIRICKQGPMDYGLGYKKSLSNASGVSFEFDGGEVYRDNVDPDWDCVVGREGYITLVACDLMPVSKESMQAIEDLGIKYNE